MGKMTQSVPVLVVVFIGILHGTCDSSELCKFNPLCTCRSKQHEVVCRGVPFYKFPSLQSLHELYQVTVTRSGMLSIDNGSFAGTSVSSLHLMQNDLRLISQEAFEGLEDYLTTIDLSNNVLQEFPAGPLKQLKHLRWLSVNSNEIIDIIPSVWSLLRSRTALQSLFLRDNLLTVVHDKAFEDLESLSVLDLGANMIYEVGSRAFPASMTSLTLSNNLLAEVPLHALYPMKRLRYLNLSGNLINHLPHAFVLQTPRLEKLDLSNNVLERLPRSIFGAELYINELDLGFNFLRTIPMQAFLGTKLRRLVLTNNRLKSMHTDAMWGIESSLSLLDLSFNLLEHVPAAVNSLKGVIHLSLKNNLLRRLEPNDFYGCRDTLEVLDLSGNRLREVPRSTLSSFSRIVRLSLQDNSINTVRANDFRGWGRSLSTLSLANNGMTHVSVHAFAHTPKLRELKLSYNNLFHLNDYLFQPIRASLEVLELSAALAERSTDPGHLVLNLKKTEWLQMDHNNITQLAETSLLSLNRLLHLDLDGNNLEMLPTEMFQSAAHQRLSFVNLSNNRINSIKTGSFNGLTRLSGVVLYNNQIETIETDAFVECPFLQTVVLSNNRISSIKPSAFRNITRLRKIFLENNFLEEFALDIVAGNVENLYLNLSNNMLRKLHAGSSFVKESHHIRTLDLSNNQLVSVPFLFLRSVSKKLLYLSISSNQIANISIPFLPHLQVLHLSFNRIEQVKELDISCCPSVQILSLSRNRIKILHENAFKDVNSIRILDLSCNKLDTIPASAVARRSLEVLNVSHNQLVLFSNELTSKHPSSLRHLDLSFNKMTSVSPHAFRTLTRLQVLNLSSNQISFLDESCFEGLTNLLHLDLSHNPLYRSFAGASLKPLASLQSLVVVNGSLADFPQLTLPALHNLDVAGNGISNISDYAFSGLSSVRHLRVSRNRLEDVPFQVWYSVPYLLSVDMSHNPITALETHSFAGLVYLKHLDIQGLPLRRLDTRTLHGARFLTTLATDTFTPLRSFRLQDLLSESPAVSSVMINVGEPNLSHQIQGAFGTKLRELTITGANLRTILPDALSRLSTNELTLRIHGTSATELPDGLLKYLPDIRFLTLDLRGNRISSLRPEVLATATREGLEIEQTQHITGGVLLEGNPWTCSCRLLWLGRWLKRWLRETFQMQLLNAEAALYVNVLTRKAVCTVPGSNTSFPLVDLKPEDIRCNVQRNSAVSLAELSSSSAAIVLLSFLAAFRTFSGAFSFSSSAVILRT